MGYFIRLTVLILMRVAVAKAADFNDKAADRDALPKVPKGFEVSVFASEPLVRQPCSMAFDARGRLYVGMGPQYRNPKPDTPGDSVAMVLDTNGDGRADKIRIFATGFNAIQGLAWHGKDLWVANAPDLTIVRDLDGDDEADEYDRIYTDLGNLEHGLHGLNWAPDGKLYMSKGNSKGLTKPGRMAPKPFRDLWGVKAPKGSPDFPLPVTFKKGNYQRAYHDPADDWGMDGGILRCDDAGHNLEIVSRGFRNPWDITADSGFNWLGTDNDQTMGDRVFMPFFGAHFGWNHPWSTHWSDVSHLPTAPVSGPLFEGSGTGIIFGGSQRFPTKYQNTFFVNDWLRKTTFVWRPHWDGALMRPRGGAWEPFVEGGSALYRPTDLEFGPDGALWILGWGRGYGAEWKDGQLTNEGRIFRVDTTDNPGKYTENPKRSKPLAQWAITELTEDFAGPLPVWRINAQDELVRRGAEVKPVLLAALRKGIPLEMEETWTVWTLGRMTPEDTEISAFLKQVLASGSTATLNLKIQAVRILAHQAHESGNNRRLPDEVKILFTDAEPRLRFALMQALIQARQENCVPELLALLATETDRTTFYAGWKALQAIATPMDLRRMLNDIRGGVRRAALLALLESGEMKLDEVQLVAEKDSDPVTREVAGLWVAKNGRGNSQIVIRGQPLQNDEQKGLPGVFSGSSSAAALVQNIKVRSGNAYKFLPGGFVAGSNAYTDRAYRLKTVPKELEKFDMLQTANNDDGSMGESWLVFDALLPVRVLVGIDIRHKNPPTWVREVFQNTQQMIALDEGAQFRLYSRVFPAGRIQLGGNTNDGIAGGKGNYVIAIEPIPMERRVQPTTIEDSLKYLDKADASRGEVLFKHPRAAGCIKCHSVDEKRNGFGPNLAAIGQRASVRHVVQSIIDPSAMITEGFNLLTVVTDDGKIYSGVMLEESGLTLSLGLGTGERIDIPKSRVDERHSSPISAMPGMALVLSPQQVADIAAFLMGSKASAAPPMISAKRFAVEEKTDKLVISLAGKPITEFVFRDPAILRPYFANVRAANGVQVTRTHPPVAGKDAQDHATMHPGIWLGFGDIGGVDFWRNKGRIEHVRFVQQPVVGSEGLSFASESRMIAPNGTIVCVLENKWRLSQGNGGWLLVWEATFRPELTDMVLGDQEEMGFGARLATQLTEKNGGQILSSTGKKSASVTWGQPARWCDYSGPGASPAGITLMAAPDNFRESWWHNRDYGVFVANPFGRASMKQGERSAITVKKGESLRVKFGAFIHDSEKYDPAKAYRIFTELVR